MSDEINEIVLPDGSTRRLGNNAPPDDARLMAYPVFGTTPQAELVDPSEWKAKCDAMGTGPESDFLPPLHDQDGVGECNPEAATGAGESQRMKQGLPYVKLSAADLYSRINGGADNGSLLEDSLREMLTNGVGTAATSGDIWKRGRWKGPAPADERAKYRLLEAYVCPTFAHCFSAVLCGFDLISGIWWYNNYTPGADGWLPRPGGGRGGHAVHGYKPTYRTNGGNVEYGIWHVNSWGAWGYQNKGYVVFPESVYQVGGIGGWWAVRSMVDEGGVIPPEPKE